LTVDTYSSLTTNMDQIVKLIGSDKENIRPTLLGLQAREDDAATAIKPMLRRAVGMTYALTRIKDGVEVQKRSTVTTTKTMMLPSRRFGRSTPR
jgi:hypothetical protein